MLNLIKCLWLMCTRYILNQVSCGFAKTNTELKVLMQHGLLVNGRKILCIPKMCVCTVCDAVARAMIKGMKQFCGWSCSYILAHQLSDVLLPKDWHWKAIKIGLTVRADWDLTTMAVTSVHREGNMCTGSLIQELTVHWGLTLHFMPS